jgi:colanic acid/amylovoran biosynthesis glycosyltransferase
VSGDRNHIGDTLEFHAATPVRRLPLASRRGRGHDFGGIMKLGMLIPEFPTQTHVFFWREIQALRSLGIEVFPISTRRPHDRCPHEFAASAIAETHYVYPPDAAAMAGLLLDPSGIVRAVRYVLSLSERGRGRLRAAGFVACAADLVRHARSVGLDHIHTHSLADAAHIVAIARLLGGPPYSLQLHGDLAVYGQDHAQKARPAQFVAAVAKLHRHQVIERLQLAPERTRALMMGVDTTRFRPPRPRPTSGPLRLITVARLALGKGHQYALEAMRAAVDRGADLRYAIVGSGPDRDQIENDIDRLGLESRVRMLGSLDESAVLERLLEADVFVLPSVGVFEASPVAVMEAMACGLAVIASRIGGTPDMISDGVDGFLVDQADVGGLSSAMERLWRDADLRRRVGEAARRRAETSFDCRARAKELLEAIRETSVAERGEALVEAVASR